MAAPELIGIGSPLVDLLLQVDDGFLEQNVPGAKGGMEMVDADAILAIVKDSVTQPVIAPGGAASNTTVGAANLGIATAFVGVIGKDDLGDHYRDALVQQQCEPRLIVNDAVPTGRVLSLITPDAERTMRTCLGAAATLSPDAISPDTFAGAKVVMVEGYLAFNPDLFRAVVTNAKAAGAEVAMDMASFEVVQASRAMLEACFDAKQIDLVFANEDEAAAWNDGGVEAALNDFAGRCKIAVVKVGKEGAWVAADGQRHHVGTEVVEAVDTTGAGDNWAAGFLAGYLRGLPLDTCAEIGARCGAAVVQITGAQIPRDRWLEIKGTLDAHIASL